MDAPLADLLHPLPVAALGVFLRGVLDETEDAYEATSEPRILVGLFNLLRLVRHLRRLVHFAAARWSLDRPWIVIF